MTMPRRAASEMDPIIATGMPMSSGHGVATTSTARNHTGGPASEPGGRGKTESDRSVARAERVAQPAEARTLLLRLAHHAHDARVSGVDGDANGAQR